MSWINTSIPLGVPAVLIEIRDEFLIGNIFKPFRACGQDVALLIQGLQELLTSWFPEYKDGFISSTNYDVLHQMWQISFCHKSFERIPLGQQLPRRDIQFTQIDGKTTFKLVEPENMTSKMPWMKETISKPLGSEKLDAESMSIEQRRALTKCPKCKSDCTQLEWYVPGNYAARAVFICGTRLSATDGIKQSQDCINNEQEMSV